MPVVEIDPVAGLSSVRSTRRWVRVTCDGRTYGMPLERVREILTPQPFTRLPGCDAEVAGLVGVRGRVVTVLDLGRILGSRAAASLPDHRLLLVDHGERIVGLVVDDASAVLDGVLRPPVPEQERLAGLDPEGPEHLGLVEAEDGSFMALDLDAVITRRIA
jgi:purine-binding chemotaxis protein CheW